MKLARAEGKHLLLPMAVNADGQLPLAKRAVALAAYGQSR
jgi:hypothetical protein